MTTSDGRGERRAVRTAATVAACAALLAWLPAAGAADWPMLGGTPARNNVAAETGLPATWDGGEKGPKQNVKWIAQLGKVTFASPVIAGGRVFIGTDAGGTGEQRGVLKCFAEADGKLLWEVSHEKLPNPAEDDGSIGICSTPCVAGDAVYYVSNRGELVCRAVADGKLRWLLDMRAELGVQPNQASSSSPLVVDGLVFAVTGHAADFKTGKVKNAAAPSFVAVDAATGKVRWQDASPGAKIMTGQWGSPGYGTFGGEAQVLFPGGDGWLYAFAAGTGKLRWRFNGKAHEPAAAGGGSHDNVFQFVAAPTTVGARFYAGIGEPEASSGPGALRCVEVSGEPGAQTAKEVWRLAGDDFNDSISMPVLHDGVLYTADAPGFVYALDAATGKKLWSHDLKANIWGSPLVADGKVYAQTSEGTVAVFAAAREKKVLAQNSSLPDVAHGTPVAANGVLYITGQRALYALALGKAAP